MLKVNQPGAEAGTAEHHTPQCKQLLGWLREGRLVQTLGHIPRIPGAGLREVKAEQNRCPPVTDSWDPALVERWVESSPHDDDAPMEEPLVGCTSVRNGKAIL